MCIHVRSVVIFITVYIYKYCKQRIYIGAIKNNFIFILKPTILLNANFAKKNTCHLTQLCGNFR